MFAKASCDKMLWHFYEILYFIIFFHDIKMTHDGSVI